MSLSSFLQTNFAFILCILIVLLYLIPSKNVEPRVKNLFYTVIGLTILDCIFHNIEIAASAQRYYSPIRLIASYFTYTGKMFFVYMLLLIFLRNSNNKVNKIMLLIPPVVGSAIEASIFFNTTVYYYDKNNFFHRGPYYMIPNYVAMIYIGILLAIIIVDLRHHETWEIVTCVVVFLVIAFTVGYELIDVDAVDIRQTAIGFVVLSYYMYFKAQVHYSEIEHKELEAEQAKEEVLTDILKKTVFTLSYAIDAKDSYTNGHSTRVAKYARRIAEIAGKSEKECEDIYYAGLLHDVGKIAIPSSIINKPDKLTHEEYEIIKSHPVEGYKILHEVNEIPQLAEAARYHHERFDGNGYPDGLIGEKIPEIARIIAVADAYDAMTSKRSYRGVLTQEKVRYEIKNGRGTQFDPEFADCMLQIIDDDPEFNLREK